MIYLWAETL